MAISDKLTYLNTTKTKIREGLNSLGADLDTEDTFRSYADAIEGIYEDYPKITGEGTDLSLDNTKQASMQIDYKGNASQNGEPTPTSPIPINVVSGDNEIQVCGKNLLNIANWVKGRINNTTGNIEYASNVSSMTIEENDIKFIVSQAWNSGIASDFIPISTGTYTFTFSHNREISVYIDTYKNQNERLSRLVSYTDSASPTTRTFTISDSNVKYIRIHFEVNTANVEYIVSDMQLEKGTTPTDFEPYQGNTYNIDLPVENLLQLPNGSKTTNGITATITNGKLKIVGTTTTNWFSICDLNISLESGTYTFSYTNKKANRYNLNIKYADNTTQVIYGNAYSNTPITLNQKATITAMFSDNNTTGATFDYEDYLMIEKGSKANSYTPYGTTPIELCKIGTYQDYIYKDDKKWYKYSAIGKKVLKGSEVWSYNSVTQGSLFRSTNTITNHLKDATYSHYSDYYKGIPANNVANRQNNQFYIQTSFNYLDIIDNRYTNSDDFKNWLSSNNVSIYYILATPTTEEITDTILLEQLDELELATSYEGQTNISQVNNDLPFILDVKALRGE